MKKLFVSRGGACPKGALLLGLTMSVSGCYGQSGSLSLEAATINSGTVTYEAPQSITNSSTFVVQSAASVTLTAGSSITLVPGFHAVGGSAAITFHANISAAAQTAPTTVTTNQGLNPSSPTKEYVHFGGRVVAIENPY